MQSGRGVHAEPTGAQQHGSVRALAITPIVTETDFMKDAIEAPLFAHGTPRDPAWNDLNRIWREATGILMLSKPCIYTLDFPPMGPNSYFNPSNECSQDEELTQNPQALSSMAVSVRIVLTLSSRPTGTDSR